MLKALIFLGGYIFLVEILHAIQKKTQFRIQIMNALGKQALFSSLGHKELSTTLGKDELYSPR